MTNWGDDDMWFNLARLAETDGLPIEPAPLNLPGVRVSPVCRHCHDPYDSVDEDTNPRYAGLCIGCAEWFRDLDQQDDVAMAHEDPAPHMRRG